MSASSWFRGVTHIRGHDAAKEPGGVHAINAADAPNVVCDHAASARGSFVTLAGLLEI